MRAGFIEKEQVAYFKEVEEPQIRNADDVKIQVKFAGICGSEVHAYHGKHPFRVAPLVSGHEFSGVVVEVASGVTKYKVGDRVTAEPHYGCGHCAECLSGNYHICPTKKVLGASYWSGSFGEFIVTPEATVVKLDDGVTFEQGALIEPLAVGMHAVRQNKIGLGQNVLIIGAGTIGLGAFLCAKLANPARIIMADVVQNNLEIAAKMGCVYTVNSATEDLEGKVMELTNGVGVDVTILAFGNAPVVELAARCTRRGGTISQIAIMPNGVGAPFALIQSKELVLRGSNMYIRKDYEVVVDALGKGQMDTSMMISKVYPIEQMTQAMEMADKRTEPVVKVLLQF